MRWIDRLRAAEKIANTDVTELTEPTKAPSVSFISAYSHASQDSGTSESDRAGAPQTLPTTQGNAEHWEAFFNERAAIAEHDAGLTHTEAESRAFDCCVVEWMNRNPAESNNPDRCAHCSGTMAGNEALPFLNGAGGRVWMHGRCHAAWIAGRRQRAARALAAIGLQPPPQAEIR